MDFICINLAKVSCCHKSDPLLLLGTVISMEKVVVVTASSFSSSSCFISIATSCFVSISAFCCSTSASTENKCSRLTGNVYVQSYICSYCILYLLTLFL